MGLVNVTNVVIPQEEVVRIRQALERIALCLEHATEIPAAPPGPDRKITPADIGSYAEHLTDPEQAGDLRDKFRSAGMSDEQIEAAIIGMLSSEEEPTE